MGKTLDSAKRGFGREIGKNAGKVISNKIFGDAHSTPIRVKIQRERTETQKIRMEAKEIEIKEKQKRTAKKHKLEKLKLKHDKEKKIDKLKDNIVKLKITKNSDTIWETLNYAFSYIENPKLESVCINKINEGIFRLQSMKEITNAQFFQDKLDKFLKEKNSREIEEQEQEELEKIKNKKNNIILIVLMIAGLIIVILFWIWIISLFL